MEIARLGKSPDAGSAGDRAKAPRAGARRSAGPRGPYNSAAKREAIVRAATLRFTYDDYDRVSLRDIAADAGVDASLIVKYFGSKEGLLHELLGPALQLSLLTEGDRATLGKRLVAMLVYDHANRKELNYYLLLMRIAMVPSLAPMLKDVIHEQLMKPFAEWLGGEDAGLRAKLINTFLSGASIQTVLAGASPMSKKETARYRKSLAETVQALVDGPAPDHGESAPKPRRR